MKVLKDYIRDVPDFPKPGILFRDITPLLQAPLAYQAVIDELAGFIRQHRADAVCAIESRGFMFACPVACSLKLPFFPIRKAGKLPSKARSITYSLEYGSGTLEMHEDAFKSGERIAIVDDLLATGGTAKAAAELVKAGGGTVSSYSFVIELSGLKGRDQLDGGKIQSLIAY